MPSLSFSIRTTSEGDWRLVRKFRIEHATDNPISYGATLDTTLGLTEEDWRLRAQRGQAQDATSLVAIDVNTGRWIGMMSAQAADADNSADVLLTGVYVTPAFRGRGHGVADALLARVVAWTLQRSSVLRLFVYEDAAPARRFYDRHGFIPSGIRRPLGFTDGWTIEMKKALKQP